MTATPESPEFFPSGARVAVLTTEPLDRFLDYKAPEDGCFLGAFVEVPLGPRKVIGVVWGPGAGDFDFAKLRRVIRVLDLAPMRGEMREFLTRAGAYTLTPLSMMLRLATRAPGLADPPSMRKVLRRGSSDPDRMTDARARVLDVMDEFDWARPLPPKNSLTSQASPRRWSKGWSNRAPSPRSKPPATVPYPTLDPTAARQTLSEDQAAAAAALEDGVMSGKYGTTLLKGVTGSGKTESI